MIPKHQKRFRFFFCRIAFLLLMALSLVRGGDAIRTPQPTRSGYATTYQLTAGWNLISINLELDDESKAQLHDKGAMTLNANSKAYVIDGNIAVSQACWLYCQKAEKLIISGNLPPKDFDFAASLKPGWNFVGPLKDSLLSGADSMAWAWSGRHFSPTDILLAGHGYFLYWSEDGWFAPPTDTYLVIDLSEGSEATDYPVSYLPAPPEGGWTDEYKTTKLVLRRIPAGTFTMGSPGAPNPELGRFSYETQHQVTLTRDFYTGVFEVTQKQWNLVMGDWPSYFKNPDYRDSRPVELVTYNAIRGSIAGSGWPTNNAVDANSFLGKLRARTGLSFDLPTEAQWEYACRAGTTTALNSGKNLTHSEECPNMAEVGRYGYNGGVYDSEYGDTSSGTAKVGSYLPNRWGLYDMHGNVWEWCLDKWNASDYSTEAVIDPVGPADGNSRGARGGAASCYAYYCRSAARFAITPEKKATLWACAWLRQ